MKQSAHGAKGLLPLLLAAAVSSVPAPAADIGKLGTRCRGGDARACAELTKIAKTGKEPGEWLSALRQISDAPTRAAIAESRLPAIQTREVVKRGVVLGRIVLCSPTKPPETGRSRHLRGCLMVNGDRIEEVAAAGVRIAGGSQETVLVILADKPGEFALATLLEAMAAMLQRGMSSWNVGATSVEVKLVTPQKTHTVPMAVLGEWNTSGPRLEERIRISTLEDETVIILASQLPPGP